VLTEAVRRRPYQVILFDEIEKAHPDVFNVLLQVLDDGRLTDGQGRTVDFKNTVIVMTSNIGSQLILAESASLTGDRANAEAVYERIKGLVWQEVKQEFRPEFLNRIDEVVVFHGLDAANIASIARIQLKNLEARLEKMDMSLDVSEAALTKLATAGFDPLFGARPLKRAIQQQLENPLSKMILEGKFGAKDTIHVDFTDRGFSFNAGQPLAA
jgi:ATP-dependent Clp protease ATP-binding subunit ClpB